MAACRPMSLFYTYIRAPEFVAKVWGKSAQVGERVLSRAWQGRPPSSSQDQGSKPAAPPARAPGTASEWAAVAAQVRPRPTSLHHLWSFPARLPHALGPLTDEFAA